MDRSYAAVIATPLPGGVRLGLRLSASGLTEIHFLPPSLLLAHATEDLAGLAVTQLERYFADPRSRFALPLEPQGGDYDLRVWAALQQIPPASTESYGALAAQLGTGARAVAGACRRNPIPIIVPCHRVVAKQGLGGYTGETGEAALAIKRWLLVHEGAL